MRSPSLISVDHDIRRLIWTDHPHHTTHLDNYLQYAPGAFVYVLNAVGIKGKNNFRDRTLLYLGSNALMGGTILALKKWVPAERPDVSPWYGIGGYAAAAATSYLRSYNDKHWFSELTTGAGIGILSIRIVYWVYPAIKRRLFPKKQPALVALPFYNAGTVGISATYFIH